VSQSIPSPDLNPIDYFLWGHLKGKVFAHKLNCDKLIEGELNAILNDVLNDVICNFQLRLKNVHQRNGWHIEHILA